jgi:hypothetical protein
MESYTEICGQKHYWPPHVSDNFNVSGMYGFSLKCCIYYYVGGTERDYKKVNA